MEIEYEIEGGITVVETLYNNPQKVMIASETGPRELVADVYGKWAIHRALENNDIWAVSYVPNGQAAGFSHLQDKAIECAWELNASGLRIDILEPFWAGRGKRTPKINAVGRELTRITKRHLRGTWAEAVRDSGVW
jgi:hypothetical protein